MEAWRSIQDQWPHAAELQHCAIEAAIKAVSELSIAEALAITRPGGRVVLVGMPGSERFDLAPLWQREIELVGAYAYGTEELPDGRAVRTFDLAFELSAAAELGRLVSARYPLERYREAIEHAATAGSRGAVKIVFEPTSPKEKRR